MVACGGNTDRNKGLQIEERGCVPNLRGASPVHCDGEGHSYTAWAVSKSGPKLAMSASGGVLGAVAKLRMSRVGGLTCRFRASLNHKDDGQPKFIKLNSQR